MAAEPASESEMEGAQAGLDRLVGREQAGDAPGGEALGPSTSTLSGVEMRRSTGDRATPSASIAIRNRPSASLREPPGGRDGEAATLSAAEVENQAGAYDMIGDRPALGVVALKAACFEQGAAPDIWGER